MAGRYNVYMVDCLEELTILQTQVNAKTILVLYSLKSITPTFPPHLPLMAKLQPTLDRSNTVLGELFTITLYHIRAE